MLDMERGVTLTAGVSLLIKEHRVEDSEVEVVLAGRIRTTLKVVSGDREHLQDLVGKPALYLDISGKIIEPVKISYRPDPLAGLMI